MCASPWLGALQSLPAGTCVTARSRREARNIPPWRPFELTFCIEEVQTGARPSGGTRRRCRCCWGMSLLLFWKKQPASRRQNQPSEEDEGARAKLRQPTAALLSPGGTRGRVFAGQCLQCKAGGERGQGEPRARARLQPGGRSSFMGCFALRLPGMKPPCFTRRQALLGGKKEDGGGFLLLSHPGEGVRRASIVECCWVLSAFKPFFLVQTMLLPFSSRDRGCRASAAS